MGTSRLLSVWIDRAEERTEHLGLDVLDYNFVLGLLAVFSVEHCAEDRGIDGQNLNKRASTSDPTDIS